MRVFASLAGSRTSRVAAHRRVLRGRVALVRPAARGHSAALRVVRLLA
jgi:hypothetical protein